VRWARRLGILGIVLLWGCATMASKPPEQALLERAQSYWEARRLHDLQTAYAMESTAQPRGTMTAFDYAQRFRNRAALHTTEIQNVTVNGNQGEVLVALEMMLPIRGRAIVKDTSRQAWVRIGGVWYHQTSTQPPRTFGEVLRSIRAPHKAGEESQGEAP